MASGELPPTEQPEEEGEAGGAGGRGESFLDQFLRRLDSDVDHHHHHHQESSPPASPSPSSSSPPAPVPSSSASLYNPSSSSSISQPNSWHFLSSSDPATAYINPALLLQGISGGPSGGLHPALDEFPWILEEFDQQRASLLPGQPSVARLVGDHPDAHPNPGQRLPYIINMQPYNLPPMMNLQAPSSSSYDHHHDHHLLLHNRRREQPPIHPNPSAAGPATAAAGSGTRSSPARGSGGYGALQAGYPSTPKEEPGSSYNTRTSSSPIHMSRAAAALEAAHESSTSTSTVVRRGASQRGGDNSGLTPSYGLDQSLQGSLQSGDVAEPVPRFERDVVVPGGVELVSQPPGRVRVSSGQFMESPGPMQMTTRPGRGGAGGAPASNSSVMLGEVNIIGGSAAGGTWTATSVGTPNTTTSSMSSGGSMSDAGDEEETEQDVQEGGSVERSKEAPGASSGKKRKIPEPSSAGGGAGGGGGDEGEDSSVKSESDTKKSPTTTNRPRKRGGAKRLREPRYAIKTRTEVDVMDDGFKWRKYGQKAVKNSPHPRNYYRCTTPQCPVRKRVERSNEDSGLVITTYEGTHTHQTPGFHRSASSGYFGDRPMFLNPSQMSPLGPGSPFLPLPPGFNFTPQQAAGQNPQIINQPMSFQGLTPQQIQSAQARLGFQQDMSMLRAHQYLGLHDHPGTPGPVKLEPFQFTTQQNLQQLRGGHGPTNPPGLLPTNFPGTRQFQGASGRDSPTGASGSSQLLDAGGSAMRRSSPSRPQGSPQAFTTLDQFNNLPPTMMSSRTSASSPRLHPQAADTGTRISDHTLLGTFMQGSSTSTGNFGRDPGGLMSSQQEQMEQIRVSHQVPLQQPVGGDRPRGSTSTSSREALQDQQLQVDHEGLLQDMVRPGTGGPGT